MTVTFNRAKGTIHIPDPLRYALIVRELELMAGAKEDPNRASLEMQYIPLVDSDKPSDWKSGNGLTPGLVLE